jgi:hypothetical protein
MTSRASDPRQCQKPGRGGVRFYVCGCSWARCWSSALHRCLVLEAGGRILSHAQQAGELITHPGEYPPLDTHRTDIGTILRGFLESEAQALALYKELLTAVEGRSVMLEEYARDMVQAEETHAGEVDKMLRQPAPAPRSS